MEMPIAWVLWIDINRNEGWTISHHSTIVEQLDFFVFDTLFALRSCPELWSIFANSAKQDMQAMHSANLLEDANQWTLRNSDWDDLVRIARFFGDHNAVRYPVTSCNILHEEMNPTLSQNMIVSTRASRQQIVHGVCYLVVDDDNS